MQYVNVVGYEPESSCDVSGKKGPCFVIAIDDGNSQRVHQSRLIELLRFLFKTKGKTSSKPPAAQSTQQA